MANRRMFSLLVVDTDRFLDMPATARLLFFDLGMRADDDGFLQNAQRIARTTGAGKDDLALLVAKGYVIPFESGVYVIRHWGVNNQIRRDRYHETLCTAEKAMLSMNAAGEYYLRDALAQTYLERLPPGCQEVVEAETENSIGKDSVYIRADDAPLIKKESRFIPPTVEEVEAYCSERNNGIDARHFVDFYESKGWLVGKTPMRDWKASMRMWERNERNRSQQQEVKNYDPYANFSWGV